MTKTRLRKAITSKKMNIAPKGMDGFVAEIKGMVFVGGRGKNWICVCETEKELSTVKAILKGYSYKVMWKGCGRIQVTAINK